MSGINSSTVLWYASRSTGLVALVLLSAAAVLGIMVTRQGRLPGLPRFAVTGLHRNLSLLALVFTIVHVLSAIADSYVSIPLAAAVVPFVSGYEGFALGLGAITFDLMIAIIVTSLLRGRMNPTLWRAIHWLAYLSWPVGVVHSILASKDLRSGWELAITVACIVAVGVAAGWRVITAAKATPRAERVSELMTKGQR
ncbi:MAG: ferric reductase-like transmembrane domain-containing protein [Streptosporangiaceae bacterium]